MLIDKALEAILEGGGSRCSSIHPLIEKDRAKTDSFYQGKKLNM